MTKPLTLPPLAAHTPHTQPATVVPIWLSDHFMLAEFVASPTAIDRQIDNTPPPMAIEAMRLLCQEVLEPLRRRHGIIRLTSGYRCQELNSLVGGAPHSQHTLGEAADIYVPSPDIGRRYFDFLCRHTPFDQLIWEPLGSKQPRWLHVSFTLRHAPRGQVIR